MNQPQTMAQLFDRLIAEIRADVEALYYGQTTGRTELFTRIGIRLNQLEELGSMVSDDCGLYEQPVPEGCTDIPPPDVSRGFTPQTLALFDGRGGYPAYVAINGVVYDVTNIPQWSAGDHFSLQAGRILSSEYELCHRAREILYKLPTVGVMVFEG